MLRAMVFSSQATFHHNTFSLPLQTSIWSSDARLADIGYSWITGSALSLFTDLIIIDDIHEIWTIRCTLLKTFREEYQKP
jgi:hypothetical protein